MVPARAAKALGLRLVRPEAGGREVVLEGGAVDVNGRGTLIATEECLLDPRVQVRNPGMSKGELEGIFREVLGAPNAIWLGKGIAGDDTHGHVDDWPFRRAPHGGPVPREERRDANHRRSGELRGLSGAHPRDGYRLEVVPLPMPAPLYMDGVRFPRATPNFYVLKRGVLVPSSTIRTTASRSASWRAVPGRRGWRGIHAVDLVWGWARSIA